MSFSVASCLLHHDGANSLNLELTDSAILTGPKTRDTVASTRVTSAWCYYMGAWNPKSGLRVYRASPITTEPPSRLQTQLLKEGEGVTAIVLPPKIAL